MNSRLVLVLALCLCSATQAWADDSVQALCKTIQTGGESITGPTVLNSISLEMTPQHSPSDRLGLNDTYEIKVDDHCKFVMRKDDLRVPPPQNKLIIDSQASFTPLYRDCSGNFITPSLNQRYILKRGTTEIGAFSIQCDIQAQIPTEEKNFNSQGLPLTIEPNNSSSAPGDSRVDTPVPHRGFASVIEEKSSDSGHHYCPLQETAPSCK